MKRKKEKGSCVLSLRRDSGNMFIVQHVVKTAEFHVGHQDGRRGSAGTHEQHYVLYIDVC